MRAAEGPERSVKKLHIERSALDAYEERLGDTLQVCRRQTGAL
jgi:hypothetical protein